MSANVHRRHLTKGQQAMATALAYPDKEKGGRGKKSGLSPEFTGADPSYVNKVRFVLSNCRDKALEVLRNSKYPLTVAYRRLSIQEPKWRVKALLTKLDSDRRTGTDYFSSKFTGKVAEIFAGLPKPKDPISFTTNDLPLLFTHSEVQQFALEHKLNKAQTKAVDGLWRF